MRLVVTAFAALAVFVTGMQPVAAHQVKTAKAREMCAQGYVGPRTVYGETKSEKEAKRIQYAWYCLAVVNGKADEAFEKYVAKDICDHSHMANAGLKPCATYDDMLKMFRGMGAMMSKGDSLEFPVYSTVNGDLVTQYGEGVDIFRVNKDGKISDHWDASPPADVDLKAHDQAFSDRMQQQIDTGKRNAAPPMGGAPGAGGSGPGAAAGAGMGPPAATP
jgi:predicted SnoaL-like aldol condensation-catalyzing enzyme